jgi:hypothetical protein
MRSVAFFKVEDPPPVGPRLIISPKPKKPSRLETHSAVHRGGAESAEKIRAKSLYQLFEVIHFLKLFNRIVRGQFSLGQTLQVIALGQKHTSPPGAGGV